MAKMTMAQLINGLNTIRKSLSDTLFDLAKHDSQSDIWNKQITSTLMAVPIIRLNELQEDLAELAKNKNLSAKDVLPFAYTEVALCIIELFSNSYSKSDAPDNYKILYQALYTPGQLLPDLPDFLPEKKDTIEINYQDVTVIVSMMIKAELLLSLIEKRPKIATYIHHYPELLVTHPTLSLLRDTAWLEKEVNKIQRTLENTFRQPQSFWDLIWQSEKVLPAKMHFAAGRLHARFYEQDHRAQIYAAELPFSAKFSSLFQKLFYHLLFWLNIPLVCHILQKSYSQTIKQNLQLAFNYMKGNSPFFSAKSIAFNLTFDILKLVFTPLTILVPLLVGFTSLPFLLLRAICSKVPFYSLRLISLTLLDVIETLKDIVLCISGILWISPIIQNAVILPPFLTAIGGLISSIVLLTIFITLGAIGLSPQILGIILGIGGLNKIIDLAFSPLISLGGVIGLMSFPILLSAITLPRLVIETAYGMQAMSQNLKAWFSSPLELPKIEQYDPIKELEGFIQSNAFLVQFPSRSCNTKPKPIPISPLEPALRPFGSRPKGVFSI